MGLCTIGCVTDGTSVDRNSCLHLSTLPECSCLHSLQLFALKYAYLLMFNPEPGYILKRKRNATVFNPRFLPNGSHGAKFLIISYVAVH